MASDVVPRPPETGRPEPRPLEPGSAHPHRSPWADEPVAVVLAGGGSRRFGSDKLSTDLDGRTLLDRALDGLPGHWSVIMVGPPRPTTRPVSWVREEPPGGGPGAGLVCGARAVLDAGGSALVSLTGDAPDGGRAALQLWQHARDRELGAVVALDRNGREQPLQVVATGQALLALAAVADATDVRARDLLPLLEPLSRLTLTDDLTADIDTPEQADHWRAGRP